MFLSSLKAGAHPPRFSRCSDGPTRHPAPGTGIRRGVSDRPPRTNGGGRPCVIPTHSLVAAKQQTTGPTANLGCCRLPRHLVDGAGMARWEQ